MVVYLTGKLGCALIFYKIKSIAIPPERVEGIWYQILEVFRGGILADWYGFLIR